MQVAFLGLGRMGRAMAGHVVPGGHGLTVWNRTPGRAGALVAAGAGEAPDVAGAVAGADVVVVMVADPAADRTVLEQVVGAAPSGSVVVDATTVGPDDARSMADLVATGGLRYVDAPVAGSVGPASDGTLGVFVGGADEDVQRVRPLLELWGDPALVQHVGGVGAGAALKLVVNLGLGVAIQGVGECLRLADALGLDHGPVLDAMSRAHFARTVTGKRAVLEGSTTGEPTFSLALLVKDLELCTGVVDGLPAADAALDSARRAVDRGWAGADYARLADLVRQP